MLKKAEEPDQDKARECYTRARREEESADHLDQLAARLNASIGLHDEDLA
jgi:hypothetical protein